MEFLSDDLTVILFHLVSVTLETDKLELHTALRKHETQLDHSNMMSTKHEQQWKKTLLRAQQLEVESTALKHRYEQQHAQQT